MSLTAGLAPDGRSCAARAGKLGKETNAKGEMLGRPMKLIYYDEKSSASENFTDLAQWFHQLRILAAGPKMQFPGVADLISRKSRPVRILHSSLGVCSASG